MLSDDTTIQQIIPCSGWFWVSTGEGEEIRFEVAAWALQKDGDVIGLLGETSATTTARKSALVPPPSIPGKYVPTSSLRFVAPRKG